MALEEAKEKEVKEEAKKNRRFSLKYMSLSSRFSMVIIIFMVILVGILSAILFKNMKDDKIKEGYNHMKYEQRAADDTIMQAISSIHMSVRIFDNDESLINLLLRAAKGESLSTEELLTIYEGDLNTLTRITANNPLMYAVRAYGVNDNLTEMMSVLYKNQRIKNLDWGNEPDIAGWHFDYKDSVFNSLTVSDNVRLVSYVDRLSSISYGTVGYIESAMRMEDMFPKLYDDEDKTDWAFYYDEDGSLYHGTNWPEEAGEIADIITENKRIRYQKDIVLIQVKNKMLMVYSLPISDLGGTYYGVHDITGGIEKVNTSRIIFIVIMLGFIALFWVIIDRLVVRKMLTDFYEILDTIRYVENKGDISVRVNEGIGETTEMGELAHQFNRMLDRIEELMREKVQKEVLIKNAGIKALQNQINAHFIYNVLESIKMLAEIDEEYVISDSITSLGKLLRYSMKWTSGNVTVGEELDYINNYVALMNLRNDFKVILSTSIPEHLLDQEIPKMSLQPVVENAILHGIAPRGEDATIYIKVREEDKFGRKSVRIEITDNGAGMPYETLQKQIKILLGEEKADDSGHGIGMKNVCDRIHLSFGKEYGMAINSEEGKYTKVTFELPYIMGERKTGYKNEKSIDS